MNAVKPSAVKPPVVKRPGRPLLSMPEQIAERIFTAIARGEYAPGDHIPEEALAEQFEVSRGPVREALRILEKDSVVRIVPNRGAHVTRLSIKEVSDLFEIRGDLVGAVVRRLSSRNEPLIARIDAEVRELESCVKEPGEASTYLACSYRLSRLLAEGSGNERLAEILGSLARQTRRYSTLGLATQARREESARTWRAMVDALQAGDRNRAVKAMENLVDASRKEAVKYLQMSSNLNNRKDLLQ